MKQKERVILYKRVFSDDGEAVLEDILNHLCHINDSMYCYGEQEQTNINMIKRELGLEIQEIVNTDLDELAKQEQDNEQDA